MKLQEKLTPEAKQLVKRAINSNKKIVRPVMKLALSNEKNIVKEALINMTDKKLDEMKQNFETVLAEMASEALTQRRTEIAREFVA